MKTIIIYESVHHGNTKKLVDAIAAQYPVDVRDVSELREDLSGYDLIGFASGIAFGKFYEEITEVARDLMPFEKDVFFLYTAGYPVGDPAKQVKEYAALRGNRIHGAYCCRGYDTYGLLKLVGGISKNCPTEDEIKGAVDYFRVVMMECEAEKKIREAGDSGWTDKTEGEET